MKPGDLVVPKERVLRLYHPYPLSPEPGVLLSRIRPPRAHRPGAHGAWHVLWRGEKHVMFDNEIEVIDDER